MKYLRKRKKILFFLSFICASYNLYFLFLLPQVDAVYLIYLDVLLAVFSTLFVMADYLGFCKKQKEMSDSLQLNSIIYQNFPEIEGFAIAGHDTEILKEQLKEQFELNCDLQDYIAKWCHEVKIPLSASLLMTEKIEDEKVRSSLKEQLERMNQQLKSALLGCKVQSSLFDIQIKSVSLSDCVKTSVHNNQFFLIKNHFQMEISVEEIYVYTDKNWFVYILDQIISNAVKYAMDKPYLKIWSEQTDTSVQLYVEDHGEGIEACDIRRIFEKGYTGRSHHNGKYKSTGMGLYMSAKIAEKLGHTIFVESEKDRFTRFWISVMQ